LASGKYRPQGKNLQIGLKRPGFLCADCRCEGRGTAKL
jgi:hypothetical protein